jgi:hypothetical protein
MIATWIQLYAPLKADIELINERVRRFPGKHVKLSHVGVRADIKDDGQTPTTATPRVTEVFFVLSNYDRQIKIHEFLHCLSCGELLYSRGVKKDCEAKKLSAS